MKCYHLVESLFSNLSVKKRLTYNFWIMSKRSSHKILEKPNKLNGNPRGDRKDTVTFSSAAKQLGETVAKRLKNMDKVDEVERLSRVPVERLENPVKSESDKKEYRVIKLPNGLKALLISDLHSGNLDDEIHNELDEEESIDSQSTGRLSHTENEEESEEDAESDYESEEDGEHGEDDKKDANSEKLAACALTIGVGSFSNPPEIPGLAHFLEHMVFMGSKKYPKENEIEAYLSKKGGYDNAWTECETTTFYFEVHEKYLVGGLDRFSQFFISPLMIKDAISREREAVDSEFQMSRLSDDARKEELMSSLAQENHPVKVFRWGNQVSLKDNVTDDNLYEEVHKFRKRHYSAHRMTLAIQARLSLDVLEDIVVSHFATIPNNNLPPSDFSTFRGPEKWYTTDFHKIIKIKPVKDIRKLEFTWLLPPILHLYKCKPLDYITALLSHEGKDSLISYLRNKKWCLELCGGNDESGFQNNSMYSMFVLQVTMTEEGCEHMKDICDAVFSYINMLKREGPQARIYDELCKIEETAFRFEKEQRPIENVELPSENMFYYESQDYIRGGDLYFEYNTDEIRRCLEALEPTKVNIIIENKKFCNEKLDKVEPWFGTEYKVEDIPSEWVERWKIIEPLPEFNLLQPNIFITQDFSLVPLPENVSKYPSKLYSDDKIEVWFRPDPKFRLPEACIGLKLESPLFIKSAENCAMIDIYIKLLVLMLVEELYPATMAKLEYKIFSQRRGMNLEFVGFNEKLPLLVKTVVKRIAEFSSILKEDIFEIVKERELRYYYNQFLKPKHLTNSTRLKIVLQNEWSQVDKYAAMQSIDFKQFIQFSREFTNELYIKCLAQGNIVQDDVVELAKVCVDLLNFEPLAVEKRPIMRTLKIPSGESYCKIHNMDKNDTNSIVANYYQVEKTDIKGVVIIDLLMLLMEDPLFNTLRTKEQLGYTVYCTPVSTYGVYGFLININTQAHKFTTEAVDDSVERFIKTFKKDLKDMSDKEFNNVADSLIKQKRSADNELREEFRRNFEEIQTDELAFDKFEQEIKVIEKMTLQEVRKWFDDHTKGGKSYKKLSLHTIGTSEEKSSTNEEVSCKSVYNIKFVVPSEKEKKKQRSVKFITNIEEFKKGLKVYPAHLSPYEKWSGD